MATALCASVRYSLNVNRNLQPPVYPGLPKALMASTIRTESHEGCGVAILGAPDDLGVRLNGGRAGACDGPRAFRDALARYGVASPHGWEWPLVYDAGDIIPSQGSDAKALQETHRRVTEVTAWLLGLGMLPIMIGGGHDLTYPFARAVTQAAGPMSGLYLDAHLDVRDTIGSGMPFRRLIEDCGVTGLHLHGLNPLVNADDHVRWFQEHGGIIHGRMDSPQDDLVRRVVGKSLFVSLDLDVLDASHAPGVSALNASGWSTREVERVVTAAGRDPRVLCFDIMELCPPHDVAGRTARVAAHMFLSFLRGVAQRPAVHHPGPRP